MPKTKERTEQVSLNELTRAAEESRAFQEAIREIDPELNHYYCSTMASTLPQIFRAEHEGHEGRVDRMLDIFYTAAEGSMRQIDESGLTAAIGELVPHLAGFSYEENAACLAYDHNYLVKTLGIPNEKARKLWPFVDAHKESTIKMFSKKGFRLASLVGPARAHFPEKKGEKWMHLSPGFWTRMAGFALGCTNVGLAVGTAGVGTGVAVASVAAGAAAVANG